MSDATAPGGDRDRVAMLSLRRDGTPDQHNPEIVGDKDVALDATKRQFRERAVAAEPDPGKHEAVAADAEAQAEATVNALHSDASTAPAPAEAAPSAPAKKASGSAKTA